jgi:hypothetical protein
MIERYREVVTTTEPSQGCPARVFFRSTEMIMSVADIPIDFFGGDVRADIVRDVLTAALSRRPLGFEPMEVKLQRALPRRRTTRSRVQDVGPMLEPANLAASAWKCAGALLAATRR